jgi:hypothetical protein
MRHAALERAERWRWMFDDGGVTEWVASNPDELRHGFGPGSATWATAKGHPVRELKNAAGDILYLREGRPIPTEGGPWE